MTESLAGIRILIVEDDSDNRDMLAVGAAPFALKILKPMTPSNWERRSASWWGERRTESSAATPGPQF